MPFKAANLARVPAGVEDLEARLLLHGGGRHVHEFVTQTNLVSDGFDAATTTDAALVNPWGLGFSPGSIFFVADNKSGVATAYDSNGGKGMRVITIPPAGGAATSSPTGILFNGSSGFFIGEGAASVPARFIFVSQDGTISGWNSNDVDPTKTIVAVDHSAQGAIYTGAAVGDVGGGTLELFVANFHDSTVEVYDNSFAPLSVPGGFADKKIPAGYAPFNIQDIGGKLYVTYASQDAAGHDAVPGPGHGYVDVFDTSGHLLQRLQHGKFLNSPWGMAVAPADWGKFSNDILVGQSGSGMVDVFSPKNGRLRGHLANNAKGSPLIIDELRSLTIGNGLSAGDTDKIYFTAGPNQEADGLLGSLAFTSVVIK